jgi:hypothetical protein
MQPQKEAMEERVDLVLAAAGVVRVVLMVEDLAAMADLV